MHVVIGLELMLYWSISHKQCWYITYKIKTSPIGHALFSYWLEGWLDYIIIMITHTL